MRRNTLILGILLLVVRVMIAQSNTSSVPSFPTAPLIELKTPEVKVYNAYRINSTSYEFSPSFYQDGIVYVSATTDGDTDKKTNTPFFELFYASFDVDGMPVDPQPFSTNINTNRHEGQASFNLDGDLLYYTSNSEIKNSKGQYAMKIYEARKGKSDWQYIVDLSFNSEEYSNRHPSISTDGKTLYFASDMPGGFGGTDIYVVKKEGTQWGLPENLGEQVNTAANDAFPFIYGEDYLFFSSQGHGGAGDYDLFVVDITGGLLGPIMHLDAPFNSPKADIGFILNPEGTMGFFASDREDGHGKDDIYLFEAPHGLFKSEKTKKAVEPIVDVPVVIVQEEESILEIPTPDIMAPIDNTPEISTPVVETKILQKVFPQDVTETETPIQETFVSKGEIKEKIVENCATLEGLALANRQDQALSDAFITIRSSKGASPILLKTDGQGRFETCLPMDCQYIIVVEKEGYQTKDRFFTLGQTSKIVQTLHLNPEQEVEKLPATDISDALTVGSLIELAPIYYNLEKGTVNLSNITELLALAHLLKKYPSIEIELIEHTDARGAEYYNYQLSQTRVTIAKDFLIQQGRVAPYRVKAIAMGEKEIRNHCKNDTPCSDEEHQYNRRTEVRITHIAEAGEVLFRLE